MYVGTDGGTRDAAATHPGRLAARTGPLGSIGDGWSTETGQRGHGQ